jgi:hypothetical protein
MKIDLVQFFNNPNHTPHGLSNDDFVRVLLENAVEQKFCIIPFVQDGKKQYSIVKRKGMDEIAFNPILEGDWLKGFPVAS